MKRRQHQPERLQAVVVGAGIIGASVAYHLSRRNVAVTVVDKHQPGSGASGHSFAWINATAKTPVSYHNFNRRSMEMWPRFANGLGTDVGLRWGGQLQWEATAERARALSQRVKQLQEWGYPCRVVDESELRQLEPGLSPGPVAAAALSEADGQVDPLRVIDACLRRAADFGAKRLFETPATGLTLAQKGGSATRVESVKTDKGEIPCDVVILAAGVDTTSLATMAGLKVPQEVSPGVVVRTDPQPALLPTVPVIYAPPLEAGRPEIHLRQFGDGTFIIGEGSQESLSRDDSPDHAEDLLARAAHYLPALSKAEAVPVPVGYRPMPLDGYPVLGFSRAAPNVYIALTHSGVTLAPLVGELAALEIVEGARVKMLRRYRPDRFS